MSGSSARSNIGAVSDADPKPGRPPTATPADGKGASGTMPPEAKPAPDAAERLSRIWLRESRRAERRRRDEGG